MTSFEILNQFDRLLCPLRAHQNADYELRKIMFWSFELQSKMNGANSGSTEELRKLQLLTDYLFQAQQFHVTAERGLASLCLKQLLLQRHAHPLVLCALISDLSNKLNLEFDFTFYEKTWTLVAEFQTDDSSEQECENKNEKKREKFYLELSDTEMRWNTFTLSPLDQLKPTYEHQWIERFYDFVQENVQQGIADSWAIEFYTLAIETNIKLTNSLLHRGLLFSKIGDKQQAYSDLKRYLLLTDPNKVPDSVKELFNSLSSILNRNETFITQI